MKVAAILLAVTPTYGLLDTFTGCGAKLSAGADHNRIVEKLNADDLAGDLMALYTEHIRAAVDTHGFLVVESMGELTPKGHVTFTEMFGKPEAHPSRGKPPGLPCMEGADCLVEVATNDKTSEYHSPEIQADHWHADATFASEPPSYTSLLARSVPGGGRGDTMWACTSRAYESLSPGLQETLTGMTAVHRDRSGLGKTAVHPVVRALPDAPAGRNRSLFVNHQFTSHFRGWTEAESAPLMDYLRHHNTNAEYVHRHRWQQGELVVWDNRQTLHYGVFDSGAAVERDDGGGGVRTMHRTTAAYERPIPVGEEGVVAAQGAGHGRKEL